MIRRQKRLLGDGTLAGLMAVLAAPLILSQSTGKISGVVVGTDGKPVPATVSVYKLGPPPASGRGDTAADGSFTISNLPAGTYDLCASAKSDGYLNTCAWSAPVSPLQLKAGQSIVGYRIVLKKGSSLQVRLNDPAGNLDAPPAKGSVAPHVIVGVFTDRRVFQPLNFSGKKSGGRDLQITIPFDQNVSLHLVGKGVKVTDSNGAPVDLKGTTITVKHNSSDNNPKPVTFNVVSKAP